MTVFGQICLLGAFVGSGYAAFAAIAGWRYGDRPLARSGVFAAVAGVGALTAVIGVLSWALLARDFRFAYVADYSSRLLPWHYCLSALWVGQAGSLLLWAWFCALLAVAYRFWPGRTASELREPAFGVLMGNVCFLVAVMVFAADPMKPSIAAPTEGAGLSPLLQHPAMLIHPPIVFLAYAGWAIPFALAVTALAGGRLDAAWVREARPWAVFSWLVLGAGIILGAEWAYEELGWGGYWGWDPVENGSLIPWLTGTAMIHCLMAWQYRGVWKKTALSLAIVTFGLCNFATFLTRSGIFSSLHAFSESPIGWMFLALMVVLTVGGGVLVVWRRGELRAERPVSSVASREAIVLIGAVALLLLTAVVCAGTVSLPLAQLILGKKIMVGPAFYNNVLIPTGLILLAATAVAPLLRWGGEPSGAQRRMLLASAAAGGVASTAALALGVRHPVALAVAGLAAVALVAPAGALVLDARKEASGGRRIGLLSALRNRRRQYAGFLIHVGFACLAVGVTGSSLGTQEHEVVMREGETVHWAGHSIRLVQLSQRELPEKLIAEAQLEVSRGDGPAVTLLPAQHYHLLQEEWTTEVAIHATWVGDFYAIARLGEGDGRAGFTFVVNPMMRWIWVGGWIFLAGVLIRLWPLGRGGRRQPLEGPHQKKQIRAEKQSLAPAGALSGDCE